jgi:hypothetical protein
MIRHWLVQDCHIGNDGHSPSVNQLLIVTEKFSLKSDALSLMSWYFCARNFALNFAYSVDAIISARRDHSLIHIISTGIRITLLSTLNSKLLPAVISVSMGIVFQFVTLTLKSDIYQRCLGTPAPCTHNFAMKSKLLQCDFGNDGYSPSVKLKSDDLQSLNDVLVFLRAILH